MSNRFNQAFIPESLDFFGIQKERNRKKLHHGVEKDICEELMELKGEGTIFVYQGHPNVYDIEKVGDLFKINMKKVRVRDVNLGERLVVNKDKKSYQFLVCMKNDKSTGKRLAKFGEDCFSKFLEFVERESQGRLAQFVPVPK